MRSGKHIVILSPGFAKDEADDITFPYLQAFLREYISTFPYDTLSIISFQYPFHRNSYQWEGVPVYPAGGKNRKGFWRLLTWWRVFVLFNTIRSKHSNLLIHSIWLTECYWMARLFSKLYGLNVVATQLGQDARKENKYLRWLRKGKSDIICCSEFGAAMMKREQGLVCTEVVPIGIRTAEFNFDTNQLRTIDVLGVGNLGPVKRFDRYLHCVHELKKSNPGLYCEIVGEGELRDLLQKQIKALGLEKNVKLLGQLNRKETLKKMSEAKLLLHTSDYEGQGYVFLEALASGASLVAMNRGFLPHHKKVKAVEKEEELAPACLKLLNGEKDYTAFVPVSISDTVLRYHNYYYK